MSWLLKYEGYPPSVVAALLLHGALLWFLLPSEFKPDEMMNIERPQSISAMTANANPQQQRRIEQLENQRRSSEAEQQRAARERAAEEARQREAREAQQRAAREEEQKAQQARQQQATREAEQKAVQEAQQKATQEAQQRAAREAEQKAAQEAQQRAAREAEQKAAAEAQQRAAAEAQAEAERQAAAQAASQSAEANVVSQYSAIIYEAVRQNWTLPPSSRNGMTVVVRLQLVPTGEIVDRAIIQSSGDDAFDRAALQAVDRADSFPELRDLPYSTFQTNFRSFNLLFRPEDLLL